MSQSAEAWQDEQDHQRQQDEAEAELHYAVLDALMTAKNLGLSKDHLLTLCFATGVNSDNLEN
jgi:hypothetical protein